MDDVRTYSGVGYVVTTAEVAQLHQALATLEDSVVPATPAAIEAMVGKLSIAFPRQTLSDAEAEVRLEQYVMGLDDVPPDLLALAYRQAIKTRTFFPTVAELRALCVGLGFRHWRIARINALIASYDRHIAAGHEPPTGLPAPPAQLTAPQERRGTTSIGDASRRILEQARAGEGNTTTTERRN